MARRMPHWLVMKIAIPTWDGRVSPVLDVARRLVVVDVQGSTEVARREAELGEAHVTARARRIAELGADVLICGAVSWPLEAILLSAGVQVIPQMCGSIEDILQAFLSGRLADGAFLMPGCFGRRQRRRGRRRGGRGRAGAGRWTL
jgi:predicted Fe-Mo cluster-binding NifX family protein